MNQILRQSALELERKTWFPAAQKAIRKYNLKKSLSDLKRNFLYSHKNSLLSCGFPFSNQMSVLGVVTGAWKEVGRTTLGANSPSIDVTSLPNKRYYMVMLSNFGMNDDEHLTFNNDTGANYARRYSVNNSFNGADGSVNNITNLFTTGNVSRPTFGVGYISNLTSKEKLVCTHAVEQSTAGAGNTPTRIEGSGKWSNASNAISSIKFTTATGNFASGSECVVLAYDPSDTQTNNFWAEVGTGIATGSSGTLDVSFTAKKYIWIQGYAEVGSVSDLLLRLGSGSLDSGANYAKRQGTNGGADTASASQSDLFLVNIGTAAKSFFNIFMVNVANKEKLIIGHYINATAAGAGSAPTRVEFASKWANTTSQADHVGIVESTGNLNSVTQIKVWGAD